MLSSSSFTVLLSAAAVMASTHQARSHNNIAKRLDNSTNGPLSFDKRDAFTNKEMTWYPTDTGADACTGKNHQDSDWYVAMGYDQFGDGSGCCGRKMRITANGKSTVATCVDECATCPQYGQIDLTKGLFKFFTDGDLDVGVIHGSWSYVDGDDDGGDDETTTTKKTTAQQTTTKKTTTQQQQTTTHKTTTQQHTTTTEKETPKTTEKETPKTTTKEEVEHTTKKTTTHHTTSTTSTTPEPEVTSTTSTRVKAAVVTSSKVIPTSSKVVPTSSKVVTSSFKQVTSAAQASSSALVFSSVEVASSIVSTADFVGTFTTSATPAVASPTDAAVGNVGSSASSNSDSDSADSDNDTAAPIGGALTGSESGAASLGASKLMAAVAILALAAVQAL
ncbi:hypothetical protein C8R43DRAFT_987247 [Mycena crocata]|nr:hypothetical protein C8R43DRAFT_987247 [Mycena crocata]